MICPVDHDLLPVISGEAVANDVQGHLQSCPSCRQRLRRLQVEVLALRHAVHEFVPLAGAGPSQFEETSDLVPTSTDKSFPVAPPPRAQPTQLPDPARIGKYVIVERLDGGGQALVYRALHPALGKELVVKLVRLPSNAHPGEQDRLVAEGKLLADLEHPFLARVYDLDFHENHPFLVMEYVRGRNLEQYARQEHPTPQQAAVLVAKVARALGAAHRRGITHQDIKPRNILMDEAGQPRLIDFGMARLRDAWGPDEERHGRISGTPAYMAPEQARGATDQVTAQSDLFALGSVLYYLLVQKAPFVESNQGAALERAARCDFDRAALHAAGVPPRLAAICLRAMAADPADRYAKAEDLAADLERFQRRSRPRGSLWAGTAALVLAGLAGWWLFPQAKAPPGPDPTPAPLLLSTPQSLIQVHRRGLLLELKDAVPLRSGDRLWIRGEVPGGFQGALFWLDSEGKLSELAPLAVSPGETQDQLLYPPQGAVPLIGPAGTEVVLVCARAAQPPRREEVEDLFPPGHPWPALPPLALALLTRDKVEMKGMARGVGPAEWEPVREVQHRLDQLRLQLRDRFAFASCAATWTVTCRCSPPGAPGRPSTASCSPGRGRSMPASGGCAWPGAPGGRPRPARARPAADRQPSGHARLRHTRPETARRLAATAPRADRPQGAPGARPGGP